MSYKPYPEYKHSGIEWIGEIPKGWEVKKLKYILDNIVSKDNKESNVYFKIELSNIESFTGKYIENENSFEGDGNLFKSGDILFNKLRPYLAKVYLAKKEGISVGELLILRTKKNVNHLYIFYRLLSVDFIEIVNSSTFGAKMPRASWDFISNLITPLPPLAEQKAIADYLDKKTSEIMTNCNACGIFINRGN